MKNSFLAVLFVACVAVTLTSTSATGEEALANAVRRAAVIPGSIDKGMDLWLDATKINPDQPQEVGSTGSIQLWRDASMQGRSASNVFTLAEQPIYLPNDAAGLPAVKFGNNNVLRSLNLQSNYLFSDGSGITMYFMVRSDHANNLDMESNRNFILDFGSYPSRGYGVYYSKGSVGMWTGSAEEGKDSGAIPTGVDCDAWVAVTVEIQFRIVDRTGDEEEEVREGRQTIWVNGNEVYSEEIETESITADDEFAAASSTSSRGPVTIGAKSSQADRSSSFFIGELAEVMSYPRILEKSSREATENYLLGKYMIDLEERAVSACVPQSHITLLADNFKVYMNGRQVASGTAQAPVESPLPRRLRRGDVLAIEATTDLDFRGIKAQVTTSLMKSKAVSEVTLVTDSTWECAGSPDQAGAGWAGLGRDRDHAKWAGLNYYDDWEWASGTDAGNNRPSSPDGVLDADAQWIWAAQSQSGGDPAADLVTPRNGAAARAPLARTVYCRATIGTAIARLSPSEGYTNEDTVVTIIGRGFGAGVTAARLKSDDVEPVVMVGARRCSAVRRLSTRHIQCTVMNYPAITQQKEDDVVVRAGTTGSASDRSAGAIAIGAWNWLCGCSTKI